MSENNRDEDRSGRTPYRGRRDGAGAQRDGAYRGRRDDNRGRRSEGEHRLRRDDRGRAQGDGGERAGRDGEVRPRRDGEYRPRREGEYRGRRDGERAPRREGEYRPRRDDERRPRRDGDYLPRRDDERAPRREGEYRPRREGEYRGRRDDDRRGPRRDGEYRPRRDDERAPRREGERRSHRSGGGSPRSGGYRGRRDADAGQGVRRQFDQDRPPRPREPDLPEEITADQLDRQVRGALRSLSKHNADAVARHLVMAGRLLDVDPELAYKHTEAAVRRAGRIDVVREAAAITAYASGRYAEALREVRTVRRLSGVDAHRPLEADAERGLGRPERALAIVQETDPKAVDGRQWIELQIVAAGARADLGEHETGLLVLEAPVLMGVRDPMMRYRLDSARADLMEHLGRQAEAEAVREQSPRPEDPEEHEVVVYDVAEELPIAQDVPTPDSADAPQDAAGQDAPDQDASGQARTEDAAQRPAQATAEPDPEEAATDNRENPQEES